MNEDEFWSVVDDAVSESKGNLTKREDALFRRLAGLPENEIVEFDYILTKLLFHAYRNDLWTAAHLVLFGCSDDCFMDFRCWLISRGRIAFYSCLNDPDQVDRWMVGESAVVFEELHGTISRAFRERSGRDLPSRLPPGLARPKAPVGPLVDLREETISRRFPKLYAHEVGWSLASGVAICGMKLRRKEPADPLDRMIDR